MALPGFSFPGIEAYSTRAMTDVGGITIVADCGNKESLLDALEYYNSIGLGPEELLFVNAPNGDIYHSILKDKELKREIFSLASEGHKIEFFCTRGDIESNFIKSLGLDWSDTVSLPGRFADRWNNKSNLRRVAIKNNLDYLFPVFSIIENGNIDLGITKRFAEVVVKPPLWASGQGMVFGSGPGVIDEYRSLHGKIPKDTIIEESLGEHTPMSVVARIKKGAVVDKWYTEQHCPRSGNFVSHTGSVLGDMPNITKQDQCWMDSILNAFLKVMVKENPTITGIVNFDCAKNNKGHYVLECNSRVTFSTYIRGIQRVMGNRTCIFHRLETSARSFKDLKLKDDIIPIVPGCLNSGYCYIVVVADSYSEAIDKARGI